MEMPHKQRTTKQPRSKNNTRTKGNSIKFIGNYERVKTTLPLLRNIEWRTVKTEMNRITQVISYISINNIKELNELI